MSIKKNSNWASLPSTTRSVPVHLSYDLKSDKLAYASGKSIFIRSIESSLESIQFVQHNSNTTVLKFSPSGYYIASGDESGNVKIWDCVGEDLILKGEYPVISGRINDISWDIESKRIIAVGNGKERYGHCFTWDSGNTVGEISGHSSQINAVTLKPNRPYRAATVSDDGGLVFYQGPPFKFTQSIRGHHTNFVRDVAYSADGEFIISVGADRKINVYEGKTGDFLKEIPNDHEGGIFGISWDLNNPRQFVTCSADASVKLFNVDDGELIKTWNLPKTIPNQQLGVVATKNYFISLSLSGNLNYFKLESDEPVNIIEGHQKSITSLIFSQDKIFSGSYDGRVLEWDANKGIGKEIKPSDSVLAHSNLIVSINESQENILTTLWDDTLKKINNGKFVNSINIDEQPRLMGSTKDITVIATLDKLIIFNEESLTRLKEIKLPFELTSALSVSSKFIVIGSVTNDIYVYDTSNFEQLNKMPPSTAKPNIAQISPNQKFVAVGDVMGKIILYNLESFTVQTSRWAFHTAKINSISWNQDNDHVVSGSLDTNVIVYSVETPSKNIKFLNSHKDGVNAVCWIGAKKFVSGGNDSCIKTWDVKFAI